MCNRLPDSVTLRSVLIMVGALGLIPHASAQTSLQLPIQFDLLNPGARSLAMGSAFIGLADDATAGLTNPAGLGQLFDPEVSFELRLQRLETSYLQGGRLSGAVTGIGIDTVAGPLFGKASDVSVIPSYASFVYPGTRWAVAAYRHEPVRVKLDFQSSGVVGLVRPNGDREARENPQVASRQISVTNYGLSAALKVSDALNVGVGMSMYRFSIDDVFRRFGLIGGKIFGPIDLSNELGATTIEGDDVGVGVNAGVLLTIHPMVRVGAVYRQAPSFDFIVTGADPAAGSPPAGSFDMPDTFTMGIAVQPSDVLTIVADYGRVQYSSLKADFVDVQTGIIPPNQFDVDDANEIHVGVEWVMANIDIAPALRFGAWYDSAHEVRYQESPDFDHLTNLLFSAALQGGKDFMHYTVGGGVSLNPRLEINAGADFTSQTRRVSTSAVLRF